MASSSTISAADKSISILYSGYLNKRNPYKGNYCRRFVVLTHEAIHWFIREEGDDLFGEERGKVILGQVLSIRVLEEQEDSCTFELQSIDYVKRIFKASSREVCNEWVSAIRSSVKSFFSSGGNDGNSDAEEKEVEILLVSLKSSSSAGAASVYSGNEIVLARQPDWRRLVTVTDVKDGDELIISTSTGGTVTLSAAMLARRAAEQREFEAPLANVILPSSLRLLILRDMYCAGEENEDKRVENWKIVFLVSDRKLAVNLLVSIMIVCVGLNTLQFITLHTSLLYMISLILAANNIFQCLVRFPGKYVRKCSYIVTIVSHAYTSPDAPVVNNPEDEIPQRFINGCDGDLVEARRRWDITRHWRETEGVNTILDEPHPNFATIRQYCPQYCAGRGKLGHAIYWERPGDFDQVQLKARGLGVSEYCRHWLFFTEYQWKYISPDPLAKSIAVLDLANVKMSSVFADDTMEGIKKTVSWANQHYPERSYVIYCVNCPSWFSMLWRVVRPLVHENTQRKVRILSKKETLQGLTEHIDITQIPVYYGGQLDYGGGDPDNCRFMSPDMVQMTEYVKKLNEKFAQKSSAFDDNSSHLAPPGLPGDSAPEANSAAPSAKVSNGKPPLATPVVTPIISSAIPTPSSMNSALATPNNLPRISGIGIPDDTPIIAKPASVKQ